MGIVTRDKDKFSLFPAEPFVSRTDVEGRAKLETGGMGGATERSFELQVEGGMNNSAEGGGQGGGGSPQSLSMSFPGSGRKMHGGEPGQDAWGGWRSPVLSSCFPFSHLLVGEGVP